MSKEAILKELREIKTACVMAQQYEIASRTRDLIKKLENE